MSLSLSPELRQMVRETVAVLGEVLKKEIGVIAYLRIEKTRQMMTRLRGSSDKKIQKVLNERLSMLSKLKPHEQMEFARSFAIMLELMNTCENAFRSQEIKKRSLGRVSHPPTSLVYVLTAHPTEARSPENIWIFHEILKILTLVFERKDKALLSSEKNLIAHWLEVAWKTSMVRHRKPQVSDEAEHIYSMIFREEVLQTILKARRELAPIQLRTWVGGDKDGHPGVNEKVFLESLQVSRNYVCTSINTRLDELRESARALRSKEILGFCKNTEVKIKDLQQIRSRDAIRVKRVKAAVALLQRKYLQTVGGTHPALLDIGSLLEMFPALVVPIEFRESSDVLTASPSGKGLAINRMLKVLATISKGGDPRWYVSEFIISMAESLEHIQIAASLVKKNLGQIRLPIVPLFEQSRAQDKSIVIVKGMLGDRRLRHALKTYWENSLEIMLGYSDSSKECGVLASRLKVAKTMYSLDRFCRGKKITPKFFQGSGGSIDRGGGSIEEQTAGLSSGALDNYKVTIQGEMVERNLANREITWRQLEQIAFYTGRRKSDPLRVWTQSPELDEFANKVAKQYREKVKSEDFLKVVEKVTPYSFLNVIKIGSRPTKRSKGMSFSGLRAIPWILCWTQTRILFPVWWGVGSAWEASSELEKKALKRAYENHPVFRVYIKALGFTLAKVEPAVWKVYLNQSTLSEAEKENICSEFVIEYKKSVACATAIMKSRNLLSWRPWLGESIHLRSPMIHPLNLLQIIAMKNQDADLLRVTVAGISSGMMTTG